MSNFAAREPSQILKTSIKHRFPYSTNGCSGMYSCMCVYYTRRHARAFTSMYSVNILGVHMGRDSNKQTLGEVRCTYSIKVGGYIYICTCIYHVYICIHIHIHIQILDTPLLHPTSLRLDFAKKKALDARQDHADGRQGSRFESLRQEGFAVRPSAEYHLLPLGGVAGLLLRNSLPE